MNWTDKFSHIPLRLADSDHLRGSRMGGTPPACFADAPVTCAVCNGPVQYILTIAGDVWQPVIAQDIAVSLFVCKDFNCRWSSRQVTTPSSLVLTVHADAPRSGIPASMDSPSEGLGLIAGPETKDLEEGQEIIIEATKVGGQPSWIQSWGYTEATRLADDGYVFLFQYTQPVYPDDKKAGPDPFNFGTAYVFARTSPETGLPLLTDLLACWQSS